MPFACKVAVVTGAAGDIGAAVTRALAQRGTLTMAVDTDREGLERLRSELQGLEIHVADVTRSEDVEAYVRHACDLWGGIDLFFNNVDVEGMPSPLEEHPEAAFDDMITANLRATFLGLKHVLPHLRDGGAIVNTASDLAFVGAAGLAGYVASKHGVLGLTKVAALEAERRGIRVNAICPTRVREIVLDADPARSLPFGDGDGFRTPDEIADLVIFLLSDGGPLRHRPEAHLNSVVVGPDGSFDVVDDPGDLGRLHR